VLQKLRVLKDTQDLAEECYRLLVELLRIADIRANDLLKGKILALALAQHGPVLL
jgi:hypothetical protein